MSDLVQSRAIMIVDPDADSRTGISAYLATHGFTVSEAESGRAMSRALAESACDLVILQLALPDVDELTLLGELRQTGRIRCIILADHTEMVDRIVALELGADDYLGKSTNRRELLARIRAVLRRSPAIDVRGVGPTSPGPMPAPPPDGLRFERVQRRLVKPDGGVIPLTTAEFNLLAAFADHTNVPLAREKLYELVYKRRWSAYDRTLDTLVAKLRRKIEKDPQNPELIKTVHGTGYIFTGIDFT